MTQPKLKVVIGLGKTGLSCVRYLVNQGFDVALVDSRENPTCLEEFKRDFSDIPCYLGSFEQPVLDEAEELIVSPGISVQEPAIAKRVAQGIPAIGDIELFVRHVHVPIIAITGSNGKSTTTSLVGEMIRCSGIPVKVGGNLGTPALDLLDKNEPAVYVLELSSFQLETTYSLKNHIATILNVSCNHLNRYDSMASYLAAKQRIYNECSVAVINRMDPDTRVETPNLGVSTSIAVYSFGLTVPKNSSEYGLIVRGGDEFFARGGECLLNVKEMKLKGRHNVTNTLAALALSTVANATRKGQLEAIKTFKGLTHRCQFIKERRGVAWYNDSKSTTVAAAIAGIGGIGPEISGKIVVIAGGQGKGADFSPLREVFAKYVSHAILMGEDADKIEKVLKGAVPIHRVKTLEEAVRLAETLAKPHDVVMLCPACASYDMFKNFEHRGEEFMKLVP